MAQKELLAPLLSSKAIRMHPAQSLYEQVPPAPLQVKTTPSSKHETQVDMVVTTNGADNSPQSIGLRVDLFSSMNYLEVTRMDWKSGTCHVDSARPLTKMRGDSSPVKKDTASSRYV
jgi:hypothetical protein